MQQTVGIICEYNPFHNGHKHQIDKIKEIMPGCRIVAIMSGNITQRGEFSLMEKHARAEIALDMGVDLVLELPFPYSTSTAEIFASAGVEIAMQIGCDYLVFGTENCDIDYLCKIAEISDSSALEDAIKPYLDDKSISYIVAKEKALKSLGFDSALYANDMLAVEYIRAINKKGAKIKPYAIKRSGAGYNDNSCQEIMSATGIRENFYKASKIISVPGQAKEKYNEIITKKEFLNLALAKDLLYRLALVIPKATIEGAYDSCGEIASLIKDTANNSKNGEEFINALSSKTYTRARILRVLIYSIYNISSIDKSPKFTYLLATNEKGRKILSDSKKSSLTIITKHADSKELDSVQQNIINTGYELDKMYLSLLATDIDLKEAYKKKPVLK